tara:strand:+ start:3822 stop:4445 length:624 start_codon:yes stop_codon:yes gene_type:complete
VIRDSDIPSSGRVVKCGYCSQTWHQKPAFISTNKVKPTSQIYERPVIKSTDRLSVKTNLNPSDNIIKASDGKTYKFLGRQWAEILPSGKTGLFAKRKIGQELNKITGRKFLKISKKTKIKKEEFDPSSSNLPDIYKPKEGMGLLGYIFLLIIVGFSLVGILKTFENDLLNVFPETKYIFELLNLQLEYLAESVKNIIVIIKDLIASY